MPNKQTQWTANWDERFKKGDTPWEEMSVPEALQALVKAHVKKSDQVVEIGCGLGTNVAFFEKKGFNIRGYDISTVAIEQAKKKHSHISNVFYTLDISASKCSNAPTSNIIIDRGCLHSFKDSKARKIVLKNYAHLLQNNGKVLLIAGNADNGEEKERIEQYGLPRLSATNIVTAAEPYFSIIELKQCRYSHIENGMTDFLAWSAVLQKRNIIHHEL